MKIIDIQPKIDKAMLQRTKTEREVAKTIISRVKSAGGEGEEWAAARARTMQDFFDINPKTATHLLKREIEAHFKGAMLYQINLRDRALRGSQER